MADIVKFDFIGIHYRRVGDVVILKFGDVTVYRRVGKIRKLGRPSIV